MTRSIQLAWRNIWRNPKRTTITLLAILLNTAILIVTLSIMQGILHKAVRDATSLVVGDLQVHGKSYRDSRSMYDSIVQPEKILSLAEKENWKASPRSYGFGLVAVGIKSAGAEFWGIDPGKENNAFRWPSQIQEGKYLSEISKKEVLLGSKLAKSLKAKVGSELVAVVQAADGSLGNELFRVKGILKSVGEETDRGAAILHSKDFEALFVSEGRIHEIGMRPSHANDAEILVSHLKKVSPENRIETWEEILPMLARFVQLSQASLWIFALIFMLAAGLGVVNTMLMATHDRIREYGLIKALGGTPGKIIRDVVTEAWLISLLATLGGVVLGILGAEYFDHVGLDLRHIVHGNINFGGIVFEPIWHAKLTFSIVIQSVLLMWSTCILASLYPGVRAAQLKPVEAMTHV